MFFNFSSESVINNITNDVFYYSLNFCSTRELKTISLVSKNACAAAFCCKFLQNNGNLKFEYKKDSTELRDLADLASKILTSFEITWVIRPKEDITPGILNFANHLLRKLLPKDISHIECDLLEASNAHHNKTLPSSAFDFENFTSLQSITFVLNETLIIPNFPETVKSINLKMDISSNSNLAVKDLGKALSSTNIKSDTITNIEIVFSEDNFDPESLESIIEIIEESGKALKKIILPDTFQPAYYAWQNLAEFAQRKNTTLILTREDHEISRFSDKNALFDEKKFEHKTKIKNKLYYFTFTPKV